MLGAVPIYHRTNDQRIIQYLQRNIATHELKTGKSTVGAWNLVSNIKTKKKQWWKLW